MSQTHTIGKHETTVKTDANGVVRVTYWSTPVVTIDGDYVTLRSDGWHTATTKLRMNQTSSQFDLGFRVFQKNHQWFVDMPNGEIITYWDHITFPRRGASANALSLEDLAYQNLPVSGARLKKAS